MTKLTASTKSTVPIPRNIHFAVLGCTLLALASVVLIAPRLMAHAWHKELELHVRGDSAPQKPVLRLAFPVSIIKVQYGLPLVLTGVIVHLGGVRQIVLCVAV